MVTIVLLTGKLIYKTENTTLQYIVKCFKGNSVYVHANSTTLQLLCIVEVIFKCQMNDAIF